MVFKRKIYDKMLKWKNEQDGRTALLIKGARRVGKSTIAEEFAKREYKSYILIDFANISKEVNSWFNDLSYLDYYLYEIDFLLATTLNYLEGEGLAKPSLYDFVPPCVEYSLTPLARNFIRENFYRKVKKIQYFPTLEKL